MMSIGIKGINDSIKLAISMLMGGCQIHRLTAPAIARRPETNTAKPACRLALYQRFLSLMV
jgi:hypothetical protein